MGLLDKINRWRGFYDESIVPELETADFSLGFESFEEFADPFARSMSMEEPLLLVVQKQTLFLNGPLGRL